MDKIIYSILVAFAISLLQGPLWIPVLTKLKFGQSIREEGPKSHQKKAGTPTMGGIIFIITAVIALFIIEKKPANEALIPLLALIGFGIIGFLDDLLIIIYRSNEGLKPYQKMTLLIIVSGILAYYASVKIGTDLYVPFINKTWDIGILYIPFIVFYFAGTTNAVNLTDGLDGLCSSVTLLIMTFFALISFAWGHYSLAVFCGILAGALLGFLRYNSHKAQIFMGDTGSLALGGAVAAVAMILKLELLVVIVGGIYVAEALSVILQVGYYKLTKKRIFRMAPLHHHYEEGGWHETKVVSIFCIATAILCLIGFLSLSVSL